MKRIFVVAISIVFFATATVQSLPAHAENHPLWQMYTALKSKKWVDLTQTFDTDTPHWKGFQAIPKGAFVAMRTDWSKRWPDMDKMQNVGADRLRTTRVGARKF